MHRLVKSNYFVGFIKIRLSGNMEEASYHNYCTLTCGCAIGNCMQLVQISQAFYGVTLIVLIIQKYMPTNH